MHKQTMTQDDDPRPCEWCEQIIAYEVHRVLDYARDDAGQIIVGEPIVGVDVPTTYYLDRNLCFCCEVCAQMARDYGTRDNPEFQEEVTRLMAELGHDAAVYEARRERTHGVRYPRPAIIGREQGRKVHW